MSHIILQRCTTVARHLPTSIDTPYKQAIFLDQTWLSRENHGCCCTNTSSRDGAYPEYQITTTTPKLTYEHTHDGSHDRTFTIRPIILTTRTMLSLHRTTLAFVAQRTHQDVRHIARSITYHCTTLAYWRFRTCVLTFEHFFHANIHKTDYEFLRSHDILVASNRATIVKGPLMPVFGRSVHFQLSITLYLKTAWSLSETDGNLDIGSKYSMYFWLLSVQCHFERSFGAFQIFFDFNSLESQKWLIPWGETDKVWASG